MPQSRPEVFRRLLFVVNPISGSIDKKTFIYALKSLSRELDFDYHYHYTSGDQDEEALGLLMDSFGPDLLVAAGGDGTINLVARIALKYACIMSIIPFGSANGLAGELLLETEAVASLKQQLHAELSYIDVLWVNRRHLCLHLGDVGVNAEMVARYQHEKVRGWWGYARQLLAAMWRSRARKFTFHWDGKQLRKRAHMVVIANATSYGTGALINPEGCIDDGYFEVCIIKRISLRSFMKVMLARYYKKDRQAPNIEYIKAQRLSMRTRRPVRLQLDGEVVGKFQEIDIEAHARVLPILAPRRPNPSPAV